VLEKIFYLALSYPSAISAFFVVAGFATCCGIYLLLRRRTKWFECSVGRFLGATLSGLVLGLVGSVVAVLAFCSLTGGDAQCGFLFFFSVPLGLAVGQLGAFGVVVWLARRR
jgi:hypothetical protein